MTAADPAYRQRRRASRNVELAASGVAGGVGSAFGAAKLRDAYKEEHPEAFARTVRRTANRASRAGVSAGRVSHLEHLATVGKPGFKPLAIATAAAATATGAKRFGEYNDVKHRRELRAAREKKNAAVAKSLRERARQAKNPPPVRRRAVDSSAIRSVGYQRQTRRLAVEMRSRPGQPYTYRVKPGEAAAMEASDSKGRYYSQHIRGQRKRVERVGPIGRGRLLAKPDTVEKMISPFGVVHAVAKSDVGNGEYKPATQLNAADRAAIKVRATSGVRRSIEAKAPNKPRGMGELYSRHGFGLSERGPHALIHDATTPSAVHPNIHYGASIPAKHHAELDRKIDPEVAGKLRHPVVIHHDPLPDSVHAAAIGAHVTTGGRGHVVLNAHEMSAGGKLNKDQASHYLGVRGHHVLNHEIAHASLKHSNPIKWMHHDELEMARRSMGEEARADARGVRGKGVYQRTGNAGTPKLARQAAKMTPKKFREHMANTTGMDRAALKGVGLGKPEVKAAVEAARTQGRVLTHYHGVRNAMRAAGAIRKNAPGCSPFGVYHGPDLGPAE